MTESHNANRLRFLVCLSGFLLYILGGGGGRALTGSCHRTVDVIPSFSSKRGHVTEKTCSNWVQT